MGNKDNKIIDLEKIKDDYYKKLDEDYDQIEYWENEGTIYKEPDELERKRRRKEIEKNGMDPDEELPY